MPAQVAGTAVAAPAAACAEAEPRAPRGLYRAVFVLALAAAVVPLWMVRYTGMLDYTSHLARCYILAHFYRAAIWQQFYRVEWGPIPNLAMDAIVTPLARWLPIGVSGKLFLTLTAVLYVSGCEALGRAAWGGRHWMALAAGLTFFNSDLLDGRVNYIFGLALVFWVLALWLRVRGRMTGPWFVTFCGLSVIVFLAHLGAAAVLGVACTVVAVQDWKRHRRAARLAAEVGCLAGPPLLLLFGFLRHNGSVGPLSWGSWELKASHLLTFVRTYSAGSELALLVGLALGAAVLVRRAQWRRDLALAALVLLGCYAAMPMHLFTADYADARFVAPGFVLLMIAVRPRPGRWRALGVAAVMALLLARVVLIGHDWMETDAEARQVLAMGVKLTPGARVDVSESTVGKSGVEGARRLALSRILDMWSVTRGAYMSNVYATRGQQPLVQRPELESCQPGEGRHCLARFDYVVTDGPPALVEVRLQAGAQAVAQWQTFTLWKVRAQHSSSSRPSGTALAAVRRGGGEAEGEHLPGELPADARPRFAGAAAARAKDEGHFGRLARLAARQDLEQNFIATRVERVELDGIAAKNEKTGHGIGNATERAWQ
ncbi:MAG: hypothetical protein ACRD1C_12925 [Terriglobales bacterium]